MTATTQALIGAAVFIVLGGFFLRESVRTRRGPASQANLALGLWWFGWIALAFGLTFLAVWLWAQVDFVRPPEKYDEPIGALVLVVMGALLAFGRNRGYRDLAEMAQRNSRWYSARAALSGLQIKGWVLLLAGLVLSGHWLARTL